MLWAEGGATSFSPTSSNPHLLQVEVQQRQQQWPLLQHAMLGTLWSMLPLLWLPLLHLKPPPRDSTTTKISTAEARKDVFRMHPELAVGSPLSQNSRQSLNSTVLYPLLHNWTTNPCHVHRLYHRFYSCIYTSPLLPAPQSPLPPPPAPPPPCTSTLTPAPPSRAAPLPPPSLLPLQVFTQKSCYM